MRETTLQALRRIASEEFPGCAVQLGTNGKSFRIVLDGIPISDHPTVIHLYDFAGQSDEQLRKFVRATCAAAVNHCLVQA